MDLIDLNQIMDLAAQYGLTDVLAKIAAFEVPLPDAAILGVFGFLLIALQRSYRGAQDRVRRMLDEAYSSELVTANRRAYQARAELSKLKLEMERERQKKRRLERKQPERRKRPHTRPIVQVHEGGQPQRQSAEAMLASLRAGEPVKAN